MHRANCLGMHRANCLARFPSRSVRIDRIKVGLRRLAFPKRHPYPRLTHVSPGCHPSPWDRVCHPVHSRSDLRSISTRYPSENEHPCKSGVVRGQWGWCNAHAGRPTSNDPHVHPTGSRKAVHARALFLSEVATLNIGRRCDDNWAAGPSM